MLKFKSYNLSKAEKKSEAENSNASSSSSPSSSSSSSTRKTTVSSYSTGTLKKTTTYVSPKIKTKPTARQINDVNNYQPPEYSKKIYPKKNVTNWKKNDTYSSKNETGKVVVIPSPKKKLERK